MRKILLLIPLLLLGLSSPAILLAQQGITVTPSILRLDLSEDQPEAEIYYKNNTKSQIELSFSAQDFSQLEEGGRVKFLKELDAKNYQYGLTSWLTFEKQSMTLSPSEEGRIKVYINKGKLTPGGHYASIQAAIKQSVVSTSGKVPIKAILSTLIFVRTATGNEREEASLQSISPIRTFLGFPDTILIRLQNKGNVELTPYGLVEIKDMFGSVVAKGVINEGSLIALPESVRRFDVSMKRQARFIAPGIYKADITVRYGKEEKRLSERVSFVSMGSINFLLVGLIIVVAVVISLSVGRSFQVRLHQRQ